MKMKFKSKLSLVGLSLLMSGINVQAMEPIERPRVPSSVKSLMTGRTIDVSHDNTYEGFIRAYGKASGEDTRKLMFIYAGNRITPETNFHDIRFATTLIATMAIGPAKGAKRISITEGINPVYQEVTNRLKRKLGVFEEHHAAFLKHVKNKEYSECGESLVQFSAALDDAASMYKLNVENRAEMQSGVLKTFKIDSNLYTLEKEEELLKITSLYTPRGEKKAIAANSWIWNFHQNMSGLSLQGKAAYIQTLEDFFKENIIRNSVFASLVIGYAFKNPEQPKEKYEINRYTIENLGFGDQVPMNDWLTCPIKVARQVIEQFNTEAEIGPTVGLTFGDIVISIRQFHKELKVGDGIQY